MRIARLESRPQKPTDLQVFVCSDCGLYHLVRPEISTRTAA